MPAGSHPFLIGAIRCTVLSDGYFSYPTPWFFPTADPIDLARALANRRLPRENILSPYTCLLVETGHHVVLVDTGGGEGLPTSGALVARLEMAGIRPKDVDTVVLTHAHPDHIGGATDLLGRPVFENARHVLSETEWDFWMASRPNLESLRVPNPLQAAMACSTRRSLAQLRHLVDLIEGEVEIVPGVRAIQAPGHTPGHLALQVSSEGEEFLNLGDAAAHPLHLEYPEWESGFDLAPAQAMATRRVLAERAVAENMRVMAFHFPFPSVGRLTARPQGGWDWTPGC